MDAETTVLLLRSDWRRPVRAAYGVLRRAAPTMIAMVAVVASIGGAFVAADRSEASAREQAADTSRRGDLKAVQTSMTHSYLHYERQAVLPVACSGHPADPRVPGARVLACFTLPPPRPPAGFTDRARQLEVEGMVLASRLADRSLAATAEKAIRSCSGPRPPQQSVTVEREPAPGPTIRPEDLEAILAVRFHDHEPCGSDYTTATAAVGEAIRAI